MHYPVNLDVRGKKCLVVGGGRVASWKVKGLLRAGGCPTVVSPEMGGDLKRLGRDRKVHLVKERFNPAHLKGHMLVIAATDDPEVNSRIGALCRKKKVLVNVVDQPADCTFTVPSVFRRGALTIAISTNGASPAFSKRIRKDLEKRYGREVGQYLRLMALMRKEIIQKIPSQKVRKCFFKKWANSNIPSLIRKG